MKVPLILPPSSLIRSQSASAYVSPCPTPSTETPGCPVLISRCPTRPRSLLYHHTIIPCLPCRPLPSPAAPCRPYLSLFTATFFTFLSSPSATLITSAPALTQCRSALTHLPDKRLHQLGCGWVSVSSCWYWSCLSCLETKLVSASRCGE